MATPFRHGPDSLQDLRTHATKLYVVHANVCVWVVSLRVLATPSRILEVYFYISVSPVCSAIQVSANLHSARVATRKT